MLKSPLYSFPRAAATLCGLLLLGACDSGGGGNNEDRGMGTLSLAITDGAVDSATEVWVRFTGIIVKPANGGQVGIEFAEPMNIDLLSLDGSNSALLLDEHEFAAGRYNWIRLELNADLDGDFDSYVMTDSGQMIELEVASQSGLQLVSGFVITQNQDTSFVIDWDLRRGLTAPANRDGWKLTPALRIIDATEYGDLGGNVDEALLTAATCTSNLAEDTGNAVYVFQGADVTPDDIDQGAVDPVATGTVTQQQDGTYGYFIAYLSPGEYTVALTCQALDDDAEANDAIEFAASANASVTNGELATVDFD